VNDAGFPGSDMERLIAFRATAQKSHDARAKEISEAFAVDCAIEDRAFDDEDTKVRDEIQRLREELARLRTRVRGQHPAAQMKREAAMKLIEANYEQDVKNLYTQRQNG
jgi:hypothetical protein